ncbi:MAG: succinylglutamate desuccinylase, partial [Flavobacteriaceae bacterium]
MTKVFSKALNKTIEVDRIIGKINGTQPGPTIIFTAGLHGNESSGIFALQDVLNEIKEKNISIKGNIYAISGNLTALKEGTRYIKQDLNR